MMSRLSVCLLVFLGVQLKVQGCFAYSVMTSFSNGCHEGLTVTAYFQTREFLFENGPPTSAPDGVWKEVADYLFEELGVYDEQLSGEVERFTLFSLLAGVRAPDTEGFSVSNLEALRSIHANPAGQYDHCLRGVDDDYNQGNVNAWRQCSERIYEHLALARDFLREEVVSAQNEKVMFSLDFYGSFEVEVWGPAYHLGWALHVLQDSFAHTIRSADLRRLVHVMNYAEAIAGSLDKKRDGLPHSNYTDRCDQEIRQVVAATIESSADLLKAASQALPVEQLESGTYIATAVEGKWMQMDSEAERGQCTLENNFCGSPWTTNALKDPVDPVWKTTCAVEVVGRNCDEATWFLLTLYALCIIWQRRR